MRNVFEYYTENSYLAHYGIKDMKWGIRRFQNPDGTLTDEGRKRYGRALSEGVKKADDAGNTAAIKAIKNKTSGVSGTNITISGVHKALEKNAAVKNFEKTNETAMSLRRAHSDINDINTRLNLQINHELEKKYGGAFHKLPLEKQIAYYADGKNMFKERASKEGYDDLIAKYKNLSKEYEKESREFLTDLLGKYGDETLKSGWAVKYNFETKEMSKQTVTDLAAIEMLRRAGGLI